MANWIIDELLSEHTAEGTGFPSLADVAREAGHNVLRTKYVPFSSSDSDFESHYDYRLNGKKVTPSILYSLHLSPDTQGATVVHGTVEFCRLFEKYVGRNYTPGLYFNENVKSFSKFAVPLSDYLLSFDYIILPLGEIKKRFSNQQSMFIKPEKSFKEFTGHVVDYKTDFDSLSNYHHIPDDMLCVVAHPRNIKGEYRYIIANGKVVTGSQYRWENKLDVRRDTHLLCDDLANHIAQEKWQADTVYVCDVALTYDHVAALVELNAFSSSGLYACDPYKIVDAVSSAANKEFMGELEDG